jgi:hypothetical protein
MGDGWSFAWTRKDLQIRTRITTAATFRWNSPPVAPTTTFAAPPHTEACPSRGPKGGERCTSRMRKQEAGPSFGQMDGLTATTRPTTCAELAEVDDDPPAEPAPTGKPTGMPRARFARGSAAREMRSSTVQVPSSPIAKKEGENAPQKTPAEMMRQRNSSFLHSGRQLGPVHIGVVFRGNSYRNGRLRRLVCNVLEQLSQ